MGPRFRNVREFYHFITVMYCSESELTSVTMNPFGYFGRSPWTGDRHSTAQHSIEMWTYIHASRVFEPTIPVLERPKRVIIVLFVDDESNC